MAGQASLFVIDLLLMLSEALLLLMQLLAQLLCLLVAAKLLLHASTPFVVNYMQYHNAIDYTLVELGWGLAVTAQTGG